MIGHNVVLHGCTHRRQQPDRHGRDRAQRRADRRQLLWSAPARSSPRARRFPDNSLIVGAPARAVRTLDDAAIKKIAGGADIGFGTSFVTPNLREKIEVYTSFDIPIYFGGTLFEAFLIRNQFEDYISVCKEYGITYMEVSDGSITIPHAEKCGYIEKLTKYGTVLSEVGSKDAEHIIPPYKWIELMRAELNAGATYVIAEAREAGNVGIYGDQVKCGKDWYRKFLPRFRRKKSLGSTAKSTATIFY